MSAIRVMTMDDYEEALALWQESEGVGLSRADERDAVARYLARNPGMSFVARAAPGDEPPGALLGAVLCGHDGRRGYLHHLAVCAAARGQGLGRALVDRCLEALRSEGIEKCHLFVYAANQGGRTFWKEIGWAERDTLVLMSRDVPEPAWDGAHGS